MRTIEREANVALLASPDGTELLGRAGAVRNVAEPGHFIHASAAALQGFGGCTQGIGIPGCDRDGPWKLQDARVG